MQWLENWIINVASPATILFPVSIRGTALNLVLQHARRLSATLRDSRIETRGWCSERCSATQKQVALGAATKSAATAAGFKASLQFVRLSCPSHTLRKRSQARELRRWVKCTLAIRRVIALFAFCFSHCILSTRAKLNELEITAGIPRHAIITRVSLGTRRMTIKKRALIICSGGKIKKRTKTTLIRSLPLFFETLIRVLTIMISETCVFFPWWEIKWQRYTFRATAREVKQKVLLNKTFGLILNDIYPSQTI